MARRLGLDPERVWDCAAAGALTALIAPRLLLVVLNVRDFLAHPLWMLGVVSVRSGPALAGGAALAALVMFLYARAAKLPMRRSLDALAPGVALGSAMASIGAFLGGSEFGTPTELPWAVTYTRRLASLWYGTPLATPLHPVQLYAAVVQSGLVVWLLWSIFCRRDRAEQRWRLRDGETMGAWLFLSGFAAFFLDTLRGDLVGHAGLLALPQVVAIGFVVVGGLLWL